MMNLTRPTLLLDKEKCLANIHKMVEKANRNKVELKPHFKTHKSSTVGSWFRDEGVKGITVSSIRMADYFARHGWNDITIAFPVNILEIDTLNSLAESVDLSLFINSNEAMGFLLKNLISPVSFYLEVDTGFKRSGVHLEDEDLLRSLIDTAEREKLLTFKGFYAHEGRTYQASKNDDVVGLYKHSLNKMMTLKEAFADHNPEISWGDTPSCSIVDDFTGIDSIHPGNFVYYDLTQSDLGANDESDIAICLASPVVGKHPYRGELVVHAGWAQLGKDQIANGDVHHFGKVVKLTDNGWEDVFEDAYVVRVSQEHGIVTMKDLDLDKIKIGELIGILPVHACATAEMMGKLITLDGEPVEMMD